MNPTDLSQYRQRSITDFVLHGGVLSSQLNASTSTQCDVLADIPTADKAMVAEYNYLDRFSPYLKISTNPLRSLFTRTRSQRELADQICSDALHINRYMQFANPAPLQTSSIRNLDSRIICIRFDNVGALLAVSAANGVIRVFDFDECQSLLQKRFVGASNDSFFEN